MISWNRVCVDPDALEYNYRLIHQQIGESKRLLAMVKSDGYGHGQAIAAAAFARAGCRDFGVAEINEGVALRDAGCTGNIHIFLGSPADQVPYYFSHRLTPVVFCLEDLRRLAAVAEAHRTVLGVYLKFDCGMSRLGFAPQDAAELAEACAQMKAISICGLMSHFPCADEPLHPSNAEVQRLFATAAEPFSRIPGLIRSMCNSGGALYLPEAHGDLVRAGISLYGYYPDSAKGRPPAGETGLRPAMRFSTSILQVNNVGAGRGVSYGHTQTVLRDSRLAVLPVGYSDGYFRALSNRGVVLIGGKRAPILGRVCMNLCMADVTDIPGVSAGAEAVLLGGQGNEFIDADEIAGWCGSISYEVLCALGNNNDRQIREKL